MIDMVLQYTMYGLGIVITVSATGLGITGWRNLSGTLRKMREALAEGQHISWYSYPPALKSIGIFQLSPAFLLIAITTFLPPTGRAWLILRLVLAFIALILVGTGLFFVLRGRRLSQGTSL